MITAKEFFDTILCDCGLIEYTDDKDCIYIIRVHADAENWHGVKCYWMNIGDTVLVRIPFNGEVDVISNQLLYETDDRTYKFKFYPKMDPLRLTDYEVKVYAKK